MSTQRAAFERSDYQRSFEIAHDPGPDPLAAGMRISRSEFDAMIALGSFNPGTVIRLPGGRRKVVRVGAGGKLEAVSHDLAKGAAH